MTAPPRRFSRSEAATYIKETYGIPCSAATLAKWACVAPYGGPPFRKFNKRYTIYDIEDVDVWAKHRLGKDQPNAEEVRGDQGPVDQGRAQHEDGEAESGAHLQRD